MHRCLRRKEHADHDGWLAPFSSKRSTQRRPQVTTLQHRVQQLEEEAVTTERRIRNEVYTEMRQHITETDKAMMQE